MHRKVQHRFQPGDLVRHIEDNEYWYVHKLTPTGYLLNQQGAVSYNRIVAEEEVTPLLKLDK